jgi:hypothetical protein
MSEELTPIEKKLRLAATLVLVGLIVEAATLESRHPVAFMLFLAPGALLLLVGIVVFLFALVSSGSAQTSKATESAESVKSGTQEPV